MNQFDQQVEYWDQVAKVALEALLSLQADMQNGKAREHPMPGYVPAAPRPDHDHPYPKTDTPKRETYDPRLTCPDRVLKELIEEEWPWGSVTPGYAALRSQEVVARLKKHGFEITPILVRERAEARW